MRDGLNFICEVLSWSTVQAFLLAVVLLIVLGTIGNRTEDEDVEDKRESKVKVRPPGTDEHLSMNGKE